MDQTGSYRDEVGEGVGPAHTDDAKDTPCKSDPDAQAAEQARREIAQLTEQLLRVRADGDNYRKRLERSQREEMRHERMTFARKLLPVWDDLERSVAHARAVTNAEQLRTGVEMTLEKFRLVLQELGRVMPWEPTSTKR